MIVAIGEVVTDSTWNDITLTLQVVVYLALALLVVSAIYRATHQGR